MEYTFSEADVQSYEEELAWLDFACGIPIDDAVFPKVIEVQSWAPKDVLVAAVGQC